MNTISESHTIAYAALAVLYLLATEPAPTHHVELIEVTRGIN